VGGGKQRSLGLFGQAQWEPTAALTVSLAARGDFFTNSDGFINDTVANAYPDESFSEFNPRLGLRWSLRRSPARDVALRAAAYRSFRAPNLSNLYRSFGTTTFVGLANPGLDPEILNGGDAGLDVRLGRLAFQLNAFYTEVEHFIGDVVVGFAPFTVERQNIGTLRSQGAELIATASLGRAWTAEVGYAFTDAEVTASSDTSLMGNQGEGAPRGVLTASLALAPSRGFGFMVRARNLASQYTDVSNTLFIPGFFVMDASARYAVEQWELFVEAKNLLDEEYIAEPEAGALGAPRQVLAGARVRLGGR
jgi:outer membrane receptor protein involved in Fe transport